MKNAMFGLIAGAGLLPALTLAHDGHGLPGTHWHATDAWGFAVAGALLALALWLSRGGK